MTAIPPLSLPLLAAALIGLRHGAPNRPALAGALAGMLSAGLAATLYAAQCTDDLPLFVATWYTIATAMVAAIGALAGSRMLRFQRASFRQASFARDDDRVVAPQAAGAAVCCMRWKRSTCCAVEGRNRS